MAGAFDDHAFHIGVHQLGLVDQELAAGLLTGQHQHRHVQRGLGEARKVLGILLEVLEILEARAHAARACVLGRVELPVGLGHGVRAVGGEVVPEVLEVGALAAIHQLQRGFAVEVEVPQIAQQPHVGPVAHAGQERIHQHDAVHFVRVLGGVRVSHHQADVMPDDLDPGIAQ